MNKKLQTYRIIESIGNSPFKMMAKIYEGTNRKLREAIASFENEDYETGYAALEKTKAAVVYLYGSLDKEKGGEVAVKLEQLYAYIVERINFAQATKDTSKLRDCIEILENIGSAWVELARREKEGEVKTPAAETTKQNSLSVSL